MKTIAVIGAGLTGITLARQIQDCARVCVFEKSRGLGGRMAVRRAEPYEFDHGAQFFTARSTQFQDLLEQYKAQTKVDTWQPRVLTLDPEKKPYKREWFEPHYVAAPGMNALCKQLANGLTVSLETRVAAIESSEQGWILRDPAGEPLGLFDWVISTLPAPQASELLPECFEHRSALAEAVFSPCFTLMLGFDTASSLNFDAAVVRGSPLSWIAVNSSKVDRSPALSLVVQSDNEWARLHLDNDTGDVRKKMLDALDDLLGDALPPPVHSAIHRWKYAKAEKGVAESFLLDASNRLIACGDWCGGNRVEDAYLSGLKLSETLLTLLKAES